VDEGHAVHFGPRLSDQAEGKWFVGMHGIWLEFVQELENPVDVLSRQGGDDHVTLAGALDAKNLAAVW
jgi:hypothetical protein